MWKHVRFITRSFSPLGYKTPRLRSVYSEDHLFYCHSATVILSLLLLLYAAKLHQGLWKCDRVINLDRFASICCRASTQVSLNLPPAVPEEPSTPFPFPACLFKHTIDLVPLLGGDKRNGWKAGNLSPPWRNSIIVAEKSLRSVRRRERPMRSEAFSFKSFERENCFLGRDSRDRR